jgi:peptidoglycan/xylan/chitin deacetylase (PgdA/CDA1 family)
LYRAGITAALRSLRRSCVRRPGLLILVYHRVRNESETAPPRYLSETLAVSRANFDSQMAYLSRHYTVLSLEAALSCLDRESLPPDDVVAITFDDGYRDNLTEALPSLVRHGLPGTIFVATDHIGTGALTWFDRLMPLLAELDLPRFRTLAGNNARPEIDALLDEYLAAPPSQRGMLINLLSEALKQVPEQDKQELLSALAASARREASAAPACNPNDRLMLDWAELRSMTKADIAIGSHSCSHPILSRIPRDSLEHELADSKRAVESNLELPCTLFAYPNGRPGDFPDDIGKLLAKQGYVAAFTTVPGVNRATTDRMRLRRVPIGNYPPSLFGLVLEFWLLLELGTP